MIPQLDFEEIKDKRKHKKQRKYDPDLELTFATFCKLMGFNEINLIIEETPSFLIEPTEQKKKKRSNSLGLPSYVPGKDQMSADPKLTRMNSKQATNE